MTQPLVSISLQTYNRGHSGYLRAALDAILAQTWADFELLVLDNHSTDNTPEIVLSYEDPRLTYLRLPPGSTPADSIRTAFRASRGTYLLTTHDDDVMEPTMLEKLMACVAKHPELLCLASNVSLMDAQGITLQQRLYDMQEDRFFAPGDYIQTYFEEKLWFPTPTLLFLRDAILSGSRSFVRKRNASYFPSGDIAGLFRLNARGHVGLLAEPLLRYRQHPAQESRTVDQSAPLVALAQYAEKLLTTHRANERLRGLLPMVRAFSARYRAQDFLFKLAGQPLERQLKALKRQWERAVPPEKRGLDPILPLEILFVELGFGLGIPADTLDRLAKLPATGGSQLAYRQWARLLHNGGAPFSGRPELQRIAILGSMLTAHLLVLAAEKSGIEVICCIDSSAARIGKNVFGVPVVPHEYLLDHGARLDAVILSSERDHEEGLRKILQPSQERWKFPVYSWKELVAESAGHADSPIAMRTRTKG